MLPTGYMERRRGTLASANGEGAAGDKEGPRGCIAGRISSRWLLKSEQVKDDLSEIKVRLTSLPLLHPALVDDWDEDLSNPLG